MTLKSRLAIAWTTLVLALGAAAIVPAVANDAGEDSKNLRQDSATSAQGGVTQGQSPKMQVQSGAAMQAKPAPRRKHTKHQGM